MLDKSIPKAVLEVHRAAAPPVTDPGHMSKKPPPLPYLLNLRDEEALRPGLVQKPRNAHNSL